MSVVAIPSASKLARSKTQSATVRTAVPSAQKALRTVAALADPTGLTNLAAWYRADLGFTAASGVWFDSSGNGANTTPQSATRPTLGAAINGKATVTFPGSASQALVTGSLTLGAFTIVVVGKVTTVAGYPVVHVTDGAVNGAYMFGTTGSSVNIARASVVTAKNLSANWFADNTSKAVAWRFAGTHASHTLDIGGSPKVLTTATSGDPGTATISGSIYIGANAAGAASMTGDIGEVVVYSRSLSEAELARLFAYTKLFWGV